LKRLTIVGLWKLADVAVLLAPGLLLSTVSA
jgi:hypothetical protein